VLNFDDLNVQRYSEEVGAGERWQFSLRGAVPRGTFLNDDVLSFARTFPNGTGEFIRLMTRQDIPIPGRHNVANVLAAAAVALAFGIGAEPVRNAVRSFAGVPHRMETVAEIAGVRYINNSMCTNPVAVAASLEACGPKPVVAIVGGKHKGGDLREMVTALRQHARHIVLIGVSAPEISAELVRTGMPYAAIQHASTLEYAVQRAAQAAVPGETVILVPGCASFDMFSGFEHRGQVFRDAVHSLSAEEHKEDNA